MPSVLYTNAQNRFLADDLHGTAREAQRDDHSHQIAAHQRDAARFDRDVRAARHRDADISRGERGRVVDAVAGHRFGMALTNLNSQRNTLLNATSEFVNQWNGMIDTGLHSKVVVVQLLIIADVAVFLLVVLSIRRSLSPLEALTKVMGRVKEGFYGEKINYSSNDEIGELAQTFNAMSTTIQKKEEEAKKVEVAKDEFLAMVTHELKTPLVPIQGYSDILLGGHLGSLNDAQKERLQIISSSASTLLQLISDLLDAQKLELGQLRVKKERNNIRESVEKTVIAMQPQATADSILLTFSLEKDINAFS